MKHENKCNAPECVSKSKVSGYCCAHYLRLRKYNSFDLPKPKSKLLLENGKSFCSKCKTEKPVADFNKDKYTCTGYSRYCKFCNKKKSRATYTNNKRSHKNCQLKIDFGITIDDYEAMCISQNNKCGICNTEIRDKALSVDHDHKTGELRGLLCNSCNLGLGHFKDSPHILRKAINYLLKHPIKQKGTFGRTKTT
jgi:hypothetical protein